MAAEPQIRKDVDLAPFIEKLREEYARLKEELVRLEGPDPHESLLEETGEITAVDNHPADEGTEVYMRDRDQLFREDLMRALNECERALEKVDEGTYGYSDQSGEFIGLERLDAIPYATLTLAEQERTPEG